jgi:hypothetical protein
MLLRNRFSVGTLFVLLGMGTVAMTGCVAAPVATEESVPEMEIVTLFVGAEQVDCVGVAPQQCLQVRSAPDQDYQLFYSDIKGFEYEPGYDYELLVQKNPVENPPADASSLKWRLIEVISKTPAAVE